METLHINPPSERDDIEYWTVTADLRTSGSGWNETNYEYEDRIKEQLDPVQAPFVEFDSEECQFFAYCQTEAAAKAVVQAYEESQS